VQDVARLFRCMAMLERSTRQTERMLKKQQVGRVPVRPAPEGQVPGGQIPGDRASGDQALGGQAPEGRAPAQVEFDVEALDAAWRDMHYRVADRVIDPVVEAGRLRSASGAGVDVASTARPPVTPQSTPVPAPAKRVKFTLCGQRIDLVKLATIPAAGAA
jgi:hypothetical protein